jgi:hypothetical protein
MHMHIRSIVLAVAGLLFSWNGAYADVAFPTPGFDRIALADAIFVGRVIGIEPQDIKMAQAPKAEKADYRVAVVAVVENVHGAKEKKTIRVAFPVPVNVPEGPRRRPVFQFKIEPGNEGLFFLRKHFEEPLLVGANFVDFVSKEGGDYKGELDNVKSLANTLGDPVAALKDKDKQQRSLAAATLIYRYRTQKPYHNKQQPISVAETDQIFSALLEADWTFGQRRGNLNGWGLFLMLGVTEEDGYRPPAKVEGGLNGLRQHVQDWRKSEKGSKYQIKRFVADAK